MSKKYLSIEEAASILGMNTSDLNRAREKGEIRAFADRGTWKFKEEDVEKLHRSRQTDSDPEVPLGGYDAGDDQIVLGDDEGALSEQPTIIRKTTDDGSDSDVRLDFDQRLASGESSGELRIPGADSDSDVRLASEPRRKKGSDSDVRLVSDKSDSDVKLVPPAGEADSDSDVKLVGGKKPAKPGADSDSDVKLDDVPSDSDSDVKLVGQRAPSDSDSDVKLVSRSGIRAQGTDSDVTIKGGKDADASDSDVALMSAGARAGSDDENTPTEIPLADFDSESGETINLSPSGAGSVLDEDSGISLAGDSGIGLASESGISLERVQDSGISLDDSSLVLSGDSGISLDSGSDSGISLDMPEDSGISLDPKPEKKKPAAPKPAPKKPAADSDDDFGATMPMIDSPGAGEDDLLDTQMEYPLAGGSDEFDSDSGSGTSVITLDDEGDVDEASATMVKKKGRGDDDLVDEEMFGGGESDEGQAGSEDDLDVSDEIIGEDDELEELDVFGAGDDDFSSEVESGESHSEMPVVTSARGGMAAPVEQEWGTGVFVTVVASALFVVMTGIVMFDLVRNCWYMSTAKVNPISSALLDMFGGFFGA